MPRLLPAALVLGAAIFAACQRAPAPEPPVRPAPEEARPPAPPPDSAETAAPVEGPEDPPVVFDTTEPPETVVEIPPARPPAPPPIPPAPPPPAPSGPAGSCDVRETERFCFTYTGTGWSPTAAERHCRAAPEARFRPGSCPTAGRIGTCTFRRSSEPEREIVYTYYAPYDVALAELACPGTFERED